MRVSHLFVMNKFKLVMNNLNILLLLYFLFFQSSIVAQTSSSSKSSELVTNSGLTFGNETEYCLEDSACATTIQLLNLSAKAQALQFRLLINKSSDDHPAIIFKDIQKGSDIKDDPSWLLDFNVIEGSSEKNGDLQDVVFVLLYSQNLNGGLLPGDYKNLFTVNYSIADPTDSAKDIKSSMKISQAEASTSDGNAIDISSNDEELKIIVKGK